MLSEIETKMNLSALQAVDSEINEIVESAAQVAIFEYSPPDGHWTKTDIEGALFVYAHRNPSERGLIVLNRLSPRNYKQAITADIEFKIDEPFLFYRSQSSGIILAVWFYVHEECSRVGALCIRLVNYLRRRQGKAFAQPSAIVASGGVTSSAMAGDPGCNANKTSDARGKQPSPKDMTFPDNPGGVKNSSSKTTNQRGTAGVSQHPCKQSNGVSTQGKDIMSLLLRARSSDTCNNGKNSKKHYNQISSNTNNTSHHASSNNRRKEVVHGNYQRRSTSGGSSSIAGTALGTKQDQPTASLGVPVVHKPVPTKALPPSVEQLFKSAAATKHQQPLAEAAYSEQSQDAPPSTITQASNASFDKTFERLLTIADCPSSNVFESGSPQSLVAQSSTHAGQFICPAPPPITECMASILNKLYESGQQVQQQQQRQYMQLYVDLGQQQGSKESGIVPVSWTRTGFLAPTDSTERADPQVADSNVSSSLRGVSSLGAKKSLTLITPEMLDESLAQAGFSLPAAPTSTARGLLRSTAVATTTVATTTVSVTAAQSTVQHSAALPQSFNSNVALSRTQLRTAIEYLLQHDDDFLTKIHQAYLQGFADRTST